MPLPLVCDGWLAALAVSSDVRSLGELSSVLNSLQRFDGKLFAVRSRLVKLDYRKTAPR
jgi:hypothetical protein